MKKGRRLLAGLLLAAVAAALCRASAGAADPPVLSAESAILVEAETGRVLVAQNAREERAMASTTKIMTALIALEQPELDSYFTVDAEAIRVEGSSMGLREGDRVTLRTLAAGMLLASGNDAANAAAVRIGRMIPWFVEMMNARAAELGMTQTHFETPPARRGGALLDRLRSGAARPGGDCKRRFSRPLLGRTAAAAVRQSPL